MKLVPRLAALILGAAPLTAQVPPATSWIWTSAPPAAPADHAWFAAEFTLDRAPTAAQLGVAADNHAQVFLNGESVATTDAWETPLLLDIAPHLRAGRNTVAFAARNEGGPAALLAFVVADRVPVFRTDAATRSFAAEPPAWPAPGGGAPATVVAAYGAQPWGTLTWNAGRTLLPADGFTCSEVAAGFGSLIAMTLDGDGAPIVSVESGGLVRLHDDDGDGRFDRATPFCDALSVCQGLCFTGADAWATGIGPKGLGFYHLPPGDEPRAAELVAPITGSVGEHGPHAVMPGPDGRLWLMLGNHVQLGTPIAADSPCKITYEGSVLPRIVDPNGHAINIAAPGGTVIAYDRATGSFARMADGFRNAYDMAFAPNGDLFTFDSDMEWDIGLPWYRAVRVVHVLPGGDYGWRTGSADWPAWYPDSLPPVLDTGRGSPTGAAWCDSPAFPAAWRGTLLLGDWSQGRILAVHLTPDGITYRGRTDVLLAGRPLPVTDFVFEKDGALLISVGGRGARGALLRLRGTDAALAAPAPADAGFHAAARPSVLNDDTPEETLATLLASPDRTQRWLASRALERRPTAAVEALARPTAPPAVRAEALLVRARQAQVAGDGSVRARLAPELVALMAPGVEAGTRLVATRALEILLLAGVPETLLGADQPADPALGSTLLPLFPSGSPPLDRELAALLARTEPDGARAKLLAALDDEPSAEEQIFLLYALSALRGGASADEARVALQHLAPLRSRPGGNSYQGYLDAIERRLVAQAPEAERDVLRALAKPAPVAAVDVVRDAPPRDPDRTRAYVEATLDAPERSAIEGALVFSRTCAACHRRGEFAGRGGPDLSTVGSRLQVADLMTAMLQPSRDISDQYRSTQLVMKDGHEFSGLVLRDDGAEIELLSGLGPTKTVKATDVAERSFSRTSAMPDGLLDGWSLRAISDLCSYLLATDPPASPAKSAWESPLPHDLHAWKGDTTGWTLKGGVLRGAGGARLELPGPADDVALECEVLLPEGRGAIELRGGLRVALGEDGWGSLVDADGKLLVAADHLMVGPALDRTGWNHVLVDLHGPRVRVVLNGIETAAADDAPLAAGALALDVQAGTASAAFRDVSVRGP